MKFNVRKFISEHLVVNISYLSAILAFAVACLYAVGNSPGTTLSSQIMLVGLVLLVPAWIHKRGYYVSSRVLMSYLTPILLMTMSIYNKHVVIAAGAVDPVNYFDIRFIIIAGLVIPMTIVSLSEWKLLLACLLPFFVCILFYDPIHIFFNVDYYRMGLPSTDYYVSANLFSIMATLFLCFGFLILKLKLERKEADLNSRRIRLAGYMNELIRVSSSKPILEGDMNNTYAEIAKTIEQVMVNDRVSVWEFDSTHDTKRCVLMSFQGGILHEDIVMRREEYPEYFDEIINNKVIVAEDAHLHKTLKVFKKAYFEPRNIQSMLEIAFRVNGRVAGVICCEGLNTRRSYFIEDIIYLKAMADTISYMHANRRQKIHNEDLEQRVRERTAEIKRKNRQLQEYAYINSHILRAPVARLDGLYHLMEMGTVNEDIMNHLKMSIDELNVITRKITLAIEDLGEFDREILN